MDEESVARNLGASEIHLCEDRGEVAEPEEDRLETASDGSAFYIIGKKGRTWWVTNEEYSTAIAYCPFCGMLLPVR